MRILDRDVLRAENFSALHAEIERENRRGLRLLALAGIPLSLVNLGAQLIVIGPRGGVSAGLLMPLYALLLFCAERRFIPDDYPRATAALYAALSPFLLLAVLLGTVLDPTHQATTILMFIVIAPVFIVDRPERLAAWLSVWLLLFALACRTVKEAELFSVDLIHVVEFYLASIVIERLVMHVRMSALKSLEETQYVLHHDRQTGCLSRYALEKQIGSLPGSPLVLVMADLDHLRLYRDFYGHSASDAMMLFFTETFSRAFGEGDTYRYGGDELLCVFHGGEEDCLALLEVCRKKLGVFELEGKRLPLSCSTGYVSGTARSTEELRGMIRLADINASKAKQQGYDRSVGGAFSEDSLHQGILESNLYTHAKAYEINHLTGLPDMSYFIARADEMLSTVADQSREPVLGYFKLLRMRDINSAFGYAQGDELIADTARLLRRAFRERHVCYVTAGEFCVLCYRDEAESGAALMREGLSRYKTGLTVSCKMGFAPCRSGQRAISALDEAKLALNSILQSSGQDVRFYDSALDEELHFRHYIVSHVDEAVEKGWLKVYYQPIARTVTGCVCAEEALSRWDDPVYGFLMPLRFIPVLEENGLMYKVNLHVVRQVLRQTKRRQELGVPVVPVSVNLSRRDFERCDMVREISAMTDEAGFPHSLLKIEITESAFITNQELLRHELGRFREAGFEVWLDDFGSEYSTLNLLQELDFDLIKLDMKFMRNFRTGSKNHIIISKVVEMAKQLGIDTLVEGVETEEHYNIMQKLGCDKVQGYLFNRPNPLDYIAKRALTGTGLRFEPEEDAAYYETISRVDLSEPMRSAERETMRVDNELESGVIEECGGEFFCLRYNESFLSRLERLGFIAGEAEGLSLRIPLSRPPEAVRETIERCRSVGEWVSLELPDAGEGRLTVFLCLLTDHGGLGARALLTVLLPARGNE